MFCFDTLSYINSLIWRRYRFDNHHPNISLVFKVFSWIRSPRRLYRVKVSRAKRGAVWTLTFSSEWKAQNLQRLKTWVTNHPSLLWSKQFFGMWHFLVLKLDNSRQTGNGYKGITRRCREKIKRL